VTRVVNVSRKVDSVTGGDLSEESKLGDTSVLELDETKAVETVLVGIIEHTKGIEESERGLGSEFSLEGIEDGGGLAGLGRGKGGGRANKGKGSELHHLDNFSWE